MFGDKTVINKDNFLKQTEDARLKRNLEKKRTSSAIKIQSLFKGYLARKQFAIKLEYNTFVQNIIKKDIFTFVFKNFRNSLNQALVETSELKTAVQLYEITKKFIIFIQTKYFKKKKNNDNQLLFQNMCTCLSNSILKGDFKHSYMSLIVSKDFYQLFLKQSHKFLQACIIELNNINLKDASHYKTFISLLSTLTMFTDHRLWKCYKIENSIILLENFINLFLN